MTKFQYEGEPVIVCRDGGYPIYKWLDPDYRKKARECVNAPDYVNSKYYLKKFFKVIGIVVNPEAMTYIHVQDYM